MHPHSQFTALRFICIELSIHDYVYLLSGLDALTVGKIIFLMSLLIRYKRKTWQSEWQISVPFSKLMPHYDMIHIYEMHSIHIFNLHSVMKNGYNSSSF
jgi:hypothetical protein